MKVAERIFEFLNEKKAPYEVFAHPKRFTAQETAEAEHIPGHSVAKVVMVRAGLKDLMVVIPADRMVNLFKLGREVGSTDLWLEEEREFQNLFPDCEVGGMPPFGSLYHLPCYVDQELVTRPDIVFNAGSHEKSIRMATKDYLALAEAVVGDFTSLS